VNRSGSGRTRDWAGKNNAVVLTTSLPSPDEDIGHKRNKKKQERASNHPTD
jgi:hypothetical protein